MENHGSQLTRYITRYAAAAVAVVAAYMVRYALSLVVGSGLPPFIIFYPTVMIVAILAGLGPSCFW